MTVITTEIRGPIAILRLNRPDAMNALGAEGDGEAVRAACDALNADLSIRCVILTGEGRAFSAGGDVKKMADPDGPFSGGGLPVRSHYQRNIHRIARALFSLDMPVIAVGLITDFEQAEAIIGTGDADLIAIARTILYDPRWPWHAAAHLGASVKAAPQYLRCQPRQYRHLFDAPKG